MNVNPECENCRHRVSEHAFFYDGSNVCLHGRRDKENYLIRDLKCRCESCMLLCGECGTRTSIGIMEQWGMCASCYNKTKVIEGREN